jgi:predicted AAA+ superfamily ATPase
MFTRQLTPHSSKSFFLFGPRQTGKSTYVKSILGRNDLYIDLLPQRNFLSYAKNPGQLRGEILSHLQKHHAFTCVIDEIQKIPLLLDEVHELIESTDIRFILTGSSSRKLRRGGANLLAGRAYTYHFFPLTFKEIGNAFQLEKALKTGCLPPLWGQEDDANEFLYSYSETYLKEEVAAEGLVRNIGPFSYFLDIMAANDGETVNFNNVARECSVSNKTVQQYYQILEDTFLAFKLPAWKTSSRKRLIAHPRYYLFDPGISNALTHNLGKNISPRTRERRFEQFFIGQLRAQIEYARLRYQLYFWRTNHGAEVDLLICQGRQILCAIEIKSSKTISRTDLSGMKSFLDSHPNTPSYVIGIDQTRRLILQETTILSWDMFLIEELPSLSNFTAT